MQHVNKSAGGGKASDSASQTGIRPRVKRAAEPCAPKGPAAQRSRKAKAPSSKVLDALYQDVMNCEPAIAPSEVAPLADLVRNQDRVGRVWRLTAVLAGKDGKFFSEMADSEEQARTMATTLGALEDFAKLVRGMADLADCVATRIGVAGCNHMQFNDWVEEACNG